MTSASVLVTDRFTRGRGQHLGHVRLGQIPGDRPEVRHERPEPVSPLGGCGSRRSARNGLDSGCPAPGRPRSPQPEARSRRLPKRRLVHSRRDSSRPCSVCPIENGGMMTSRTEHQGAPGRGRAVTTTSMLRALPETDWSTPTPCSDCDLGTLAQHVVGTTAGMIKVGRRDPFDPENLWSGPRVDQGDWAEVLAGNLEALAAAWSEDDAWRGTVQVGGEMPAATIGDMAYAEILLHGWDIAQACGAQLSVSPPVAAALRRTVSETAELGRRMHAYADPVIDRAGSRRPRPGAGAGRPRPSLDPLVGRSALPGGELQRRPNRPPHVLGRRPAPSACVRSDPAARQAVLGRPDLGVPRPSWSCSRCHSSVSFTSDPRRTQRQAADRGRDRRRRARPYRTLTIRIGAGRTRLRETATPNSTTAAPTG